MVKKAARFSCCFFVSVDVLWVSCVVPLHFRSGHCRAAWNGAVLAFAALEAAPSGASFDVNMASRIIGIGCARGDADGFPYPTLHRTGVCHPDRFDGTNASSLEHAS